LYYRLYHVVDDAGQEMSGDVLLRGRAYALRFWPYPDAAAMVPQHRACLGRKSAACLPHYWI
jgi:hypothetical protein